MWNYVTWNFRTCLLQQYRNTLFLISQQYICIRLLPLHYWGGKTAIYENLFCRRPMGFQEEKKATLLLANHFLHQYPATNRRSSACVRQLPVCISDAPYHTLCTQALSGAEGTFVLPGQGNFLPTDKEDGRAQEAVWLLNRRNTSCP